MVFGRDIPGLDMGSYIPGEGKFLPKELNFLEKGGRASRFFTIVEQMKKVLSDGSDSRQFSAEEMAVSGMCGYASNAVTEGLRKRGLDARVVYGHFVDSVDYRHYDPKKVDPFNHRATHHFWTEAKMGDEIWEIDAAYGQFDPQKEGKFLYYPKSSSDKYKLHEFHEGDMSTLFTDEGIAKALRAHGGLLPLQDRIIGDERLRKLYQRLVAVIG